MAESSHGVPWCLWRDTHSASKFEGGFFYCQAGRCVKIAKKCYMVYIYMVSKSIFTSARRHFFQGVYAKLNAVFASRCFFNFKYNFFTVNIMYMVQLIFLYC